MQKLVGLVAALLGAAFVLSATPVLAQQPRTATWGKFYAGITAGAVIPEDVNLSASGTVGGVASSASGKISYKNAAAVSGLVGYHLNDYLAGEAELGYASVDYDHITGSGTVGSVTFSGTATVNGHTDVLTGMVDGIVTPMGRSRISPYVGAGVGFANLDSHLDSVSAAGVTQTVNASESETDFAFNVLAGIDFAVTDSLSLGARYRYLWINTSSSSTSAGLTTKSGDTTAHVITANATWRF